MLLTELAENYLPETNQIVSESTTGYLRSCAMSYSGFLGKRSTTDDLETGNANRYVRWLAANRAASTVRTKRSGLLMLWRCAYRLELAGEPKRIIAPRLKKTPVRAWTLDEVRKLRDHCLAMPGSFENGIPKRLFYGSLVAAGYEMGLRLSDQLSIERDWLLPIGDDECRITIVEHKTRKQCRRILSKQTMRFIDQCMGESDRKLIWPLDVRRETFYEHIRKIVKGAGIRKGTFRYLRRTAGTQAEINQPGGGQIFLNHSSPQVTRESYLDQWQTSPNPMRVTEL